MRAINDLRALLPFAKAADDYEPPKSKRRFRDEEHVALSLTVGHLREARRALVQVVETATATDPTQQQREVEGEG